MLKTCLRTVLVASSFMVCLGAQVSQCIYSMNQSQTSWCHSDPASGGKNDSPFIEADQGGDCIPYFGLWIWGRRWVPDSIIRWNPIIVGDQEGFEVYGYFLSSCAGITGKCEMSSTNCDFTPGVDDSILVKFRVYNRVDCEDPATKAKFIDCPKANTGCYNYGDDQAQMFSELEGDLTFAGGRRFWLENRYMGGGKPASPILLGNGANLHNTEYGASFWFQAHAYDNNEYLDGDFNVDIERCPILFNEVDEFPECRDVPNIDTLTPTIIGSRYAGFEHNPGGINSNHLAIMFKEERKMIPVENVVYKEIRNVDDSSGGSRHLSSMRKKALMVANMREGIDGVISFRGQLKDIFDESYQAVVNVKLWRGRKRFSCAKDLTLADESFNRVEPYYCYDERFATTEEKDSWTYFGRMNASITLLDNQSPSGKCALTHEGFYSPQLGLAAQIKRQDFSIGKMGVSIWARMVNCTGGLAHLERTTVDFNMVIDEMPIIPSKKIPCRVSAIDFP